jgi:hypothetical protein
MILFRLGRRYMSEQKYWLIYHVDSKSVSALHKDNYENIYCQIVGQKHFVLLAPLAQACVNERNLYPASYHRHRTELRIREETESDLVPFATWDPDKPGEETTSYSHLVTPIRVTLDAGDILYLPALVKALTSPFFLDTKANCFAVVSGFLSGRSSWLVIIPHIQVSIKERTNGAIMELTCEGITKSHNLVQKKDCAVLSVSSHLPCMTFASSHNTNYGTLDYW